MAATKRRDSKTGEPAIKESAGSIEVDLEVHVAGLCLVEAKGCSSYNVAQQRGPSEASSVRLLMVPTSPGGHHPKHHPCLTYYLEEDLGLLPGRSGRVKLLPSPEGGSVVQVSLEACRVDFEMPYGPKPKKSSFDWKPLATPNEDCWPQSASEDHYLDWAFRARDLGLCEIDEERSACVVNLPSGHWSCRGAYRNRETFPQQAVRWKIKNTAAPIQAGATSLVLKIGRLRYAPRIRITEKRTGAIIRDLFPTPGTDRQLKLCFSNTPEYFTGDIRSHIGAYQALARNGIVNGVERVDDVATASSPPCESVIWFPPRSARSRGTS